MRRPRIIPVLLLKGGGLVKSKRFSQHRYLGDPINAIKIFSELQADEIMVLDIQASAEGRTIPVEMVRELGEEVCMPLTVGGGIRTLEQIHQLVTAGAEKVVLCSSAVENPDFVAQAANKFGSSTISVCLDLKKCLFRGQKVFSRCGSKRSRFSPLEFARLMESQGAGELIVQSIDHDGLMSGYSLAPLQEISNVVGIPVVALGGAGSLQDLNTVFQSTHLSGAAAGSLFVFQGTQRGVLLNYPERAELTALFGKPAC